MAGHIKASERIKSSIEEIQTIIDYLYEKKVDFDVLQIGPHALKFVIYPPTIGYVYFECNTESQQSMFNLLNIFYLLYK